MSLIADVIVPGWALAYRTELPGGAELMSWGKYLGKRGNIHEFKFWQRFRMSTKKMKDDSRAVVSLSTEANYFPVNLELSTNGVPFSLSFDGSSFRSELYEGSLIEGEVGSADFVLLANMLPMLAIRMCLAERGGKVSLMQLRFFSPEILASVEYLLKRRDDHTWESSFGEEIQVDSCGVPTRLTTTTGAIVTRCNEPIPKWRDHPKITLHYESPPATYSESSSSSPGNREQDIIIDTDEETVHGTLLLPAANVACHAGAVLYAGSGKHDRDGRGAHVDLGYRRFCERLADAGIATLRYDKPGTGTTRLGRNALRPNYAHAVETARQALSTFRQQEKICTLPIFLVGHSEGGLIALEIGADMDALAGVILMATAGRALDVVVAEQVERQCARAGLSPELTQAQLHDLAEFYSYVKNTNEWNTETVPARILAMERAGRWSRQVLMRHPNQLIARVKCPVLILQGDCDVQVTVEDALILHDAAEQASISHDLVILKGHDHLFRKTHRKDDIESYTDRRRRISKDTVKAVQRWILTVLRAV